MAKLTMSEFRQMTDDERDAAVRELAGSATRPAFAFRQQIEEMERDLQDFERRTGRTVAQWREGLYAWTLTETEEVCRMMLLDAKYQRSLRSLARAKLTS